MYRRDVVWLTASEAARTLLAQRRSLLGYAMREAAACEMLYGGVRLRHLVQRPFPLHYIKSEALPPPSLDRERHDLGLEMQLPRDLQNYGNVNLAIQRQAGNAEDDDEDGAALMTSERRRQGLDFGSFMADSFHPERAHNSSPPYAPHDTNNVLALRLFPVNVNIRARTEAIRLRTEDCLRRLQSAKLCARAGRPLRYPLPYAEQQALQRAARARGAHDESLYVPSPSNPHRPASAEERAQLAARREGRAAGDATRVGERYAHLHGAAYHPRPSQLSLFTRPVDCGGAEQQEKENDDVTVRQPGQLRQAYLAAALHPFRPPQYWLPMQILKPLAHVWHPAMRGSGPRGPSMSLYQERLDQKGYGWKRKSRYLWQQDIDTAGFRPRRYY